MTVGNYKLKEIPREFKSQEQFDSVDKALNYLKEFKIYKYSHKDSDGDIM